VGPFDDRQVFDLHLTACLQSADRVYFTIVDNRSKRAVGLAAYLHIEAAHRAIEVGSIVFSRGLQRTAGATEAMFLMAGYVFDTLCAAHCDREQRGGVERGSGRKRDPTDATGLPPCSGRTA
jgi:RimJ/RimL family protein N-acetyltransferase